MNVRTLRLGTRGSALALWQANWTKSQLEQRWPDLAVELVPIKTTGDKILDVPLAKVGGKGLFMKEIDETLLDGRIDLAVHSMKDVPFQLPPGIVFGAIPEREDPRRGPACLRHRVSSRRSFDTANSSGSGARTDSHRRDCRARASTRPWRELSGSNWRKGESRRRPLNH